ncbi:RNA-directed DNA polymerase, eukaryota [Tanacetum coccineum]|uniref:RNA-directed DNA polymerase, eukaryota n=1 Tax=Tanacetum coccineum TaxID=301880 RepID=A0ABQ5B3K2_9ASTR
MGKKERQILDGPFILNEILQWSKTKKKQSLIFNVDFEKEYDSVRWDFLDDILKKFGFGEKWCKWIQSCLRSLRGSILINGSPTEEFQFYKGLKQGDPLSPFLFFLILESLHLSFQRVVDNGIFNGIKLSSSINMSKSKILGVNVDSDKVKGAASKLECLILKTPFTYLGSKVGGSMSRVHAWNEVIDRVKNWLSKWKMKMLSIGGSLESCKLITVGAKLAHPSLEYSFRRNPRGEVEQDQFNELLALVHDVSLIPMSDRWKWDLESLGDFSVASVKTDSLPTRFNVSRRGIDIDSIICAICDNGVEMSRHLFFYCCMVRQIVCKITRWWDVLYVDVESYKDWYRCNASFSWYDWVKNSNLVTV